MTQDSVLTALYRAQSLLHDEPDAAVIVADLVNRRAAERHPTGREDIRAVTIAGLPYEVDVGDRFGRALYYGSRQEHHELAVFLSLCPPGGEVWDVGANFGLYAVAAARRGRAGRVVAFEPNRRAFALLERNLASGGVIPQARAHRVALAGDDGIATFFEAEETAFSGLSDTGRSHLLSSYEVTVRRLDSVWQEEGSRPIDLLKIDVEGHEGDVLAGAREALAASPGVVIQFEVSAKNLDESRRARLFQALAELEADGLAIWRPGAEPQRLSVTSPDFLDRADGNVFMVRGGSAREQKLLAAATVPLPVADADDTDGLSALFVQGARRQAQIQARFDEHVVASEAIIHRLEDDVQRLEGNVEDHRRIIESNDTKSKALVADLEALIHRLEEEIAAWKNRVESYKDLVEAQRERYEQKSRLSQKAHARLERSLQDMGGLLDRMRDALRAAILASARNAGLPVQPLEPVPDASLLVILAGRLPDGTSAEAVAAGLAGGRPWRVAVAGPADGTLVAGDKVGAFAPADGDHPLRRRLAVLVGASCSGCLLIVDPARPPEAEAVEQAARVLAGVDGETTDGGGKPPGAVWLEAPGGLLVSGPVLLAATAADLAAATAGTETGGAPDLAAGLQALVQEVGFAVRTVTGEVLPPVGRRPGGGATILAPQRLARPESLAVLVRARGRKIPLGATASAAALACGPLFNGCVDVVDARPERLPPLDPPRGMGLVVVPDPLPALGYTRSMVAALAAVEADHVLLLGTDGFVTPEGVRQALARWQEAAAAGRRVAAVAFAAVDATGADGTVVAEQVGAWPVLRQGIVSLAALRAAGLPSPDEARGTGFEVALSLRLLQAGFEILFPGGEAVYHARLPPVVTPVEDRDFLTRVWGLPLDEAKVP